MRLKVKDLLLLGFVAAATYFFKLWFITLSPQPVIWDQDGYRRYAEKILQYKLTGTTGRTYAYPMFLALNFFLFGLNNFSAIYKTQAVIEVTSGLLLFFLAGKIFRSKKIAYSTLFLYSFNPFTSAYVGVLLTEIPAAFLIVLSLLLFSLLLSFVRSRFNRENGAKESYPPKPWAKAGFVFYLTLFLGFAAGLLTQTRPVFFYWNILILFLVPYLTFRLPSLRLASFLLLLTGTLLASSYQIVSNVRLFQQFSVTTVDFAFARELYDGALLKTAPLFPDRPEAYPLEMQIMYGEYNEAPRNAFERKKMADKYLKKAIDLIKKDPLDYLGVRVQKMWSMWQKQNLFFYTEPDFERHWRYTYLTNTILLALALYGFILGYLSKDLLLHKTTIFAVSIVLYMTLALSFTHAEPRLTIPAYPLLFLFGAFGLASLIAKIKKPTF